MASESISPEATRRRILPGFRLACPLSGCCAGTEAARFALLGVSLMRVPRRARMDGRSSAACFSQAALTASRLILPRDVRGIRRSPTSARASCARPVGDFIQACKSANCLSSFRSLIRPPCPRPGRRWGRPARTRRHPGAVKALDHGVDVRRINLHAALVDFVTLSAAQQQPAASSRNRCRRS